MNQKNFWLRTLNIRTEEGWLVKKLFLLQFFQGAGIAFFFTAAFALFLSRFPIHQLPYVFIYSSILLWLAGFIYSRLEHKFNISKLGIIITTFMIVSMILFRLAFVYVEADWFLYWMLAWHPVLYLLNNLEFWGVASLLFDARQSKRLFGVISAGDIPAKFIGYSLALLAVDYIGTINLLWAGIICMGASIPFIISIKNSGKLVEIHHHKKPVARKSSQGLDDFLKNFSGSTLVRRLSVLSIIISASFIIINFAFYAGVKEAYPDDISLAKFIAFFLAIVRIIALVVKMIFTGRLINKLGIKQSLLITPVVMLLLICTIILTQNLLGYQKIIIYLFGATYLVVDILRSAINSPVFLTIMQPLSNHERLRAHTIVKGVMDPFATLIAGLILLFLIDYQHKADLLSLSYLLLSFCFLWMIGIYRVNSQYLKTVIKTISSRYFNLENFSINDSDTLNWLKEKAKTGTETEVINILNMLCSGSKDLSEELILAALQHPSEKVKIATLKLIQFKSFPASEKLLLPLLQQNTNPLIIAESIKIICRNVSDNQIILPYLDHDDPSIRQAAIAGLFFYGSGQSRELATSILMQMISSEINSERLMVAEILSGQENGTHIEMILQLMNDPCTDVRKMAFLAAGKAGNKQLLQELINRIDRDELAIIQALFVAGELSLPFIVEYITSVKAKGRQKEKLILLCGRLGGEKAKEILLQLLTNQPADYSSVIKAMYRSNYKPALPDQPVFLSLANKLLSRCADIVYMQNSLEPHHKKYQLLINAFYLELDGLRESLLNIFALLYDREHINKVRTAYATGKKESIINAMEIIDISVRKDIGSSFNTIFEPGDIGERMHDLRKIFPVELFKNVERVLILILTEETRPFNNWTLACALYTTKKYHQKIDISIIKKYTTSEDKLLKETALYCL